MEGLTTELLSQTEIVEYHDPAERLNELRAEVRAVGIKTVARVARLGTREVRAILNQGRRPHSSTLARLEAALLAIAEAEQGRWRG